MRFMGLYYFFDYYYLDKTKQMENYLITLGMYLILMLFFKIYFAVATTKD
jgi:hypothetical protein